MSENLFRARKIRRRHLSEHSVEHVTARGRHRDAEARTRLRLYATRLGTWIVREESGRCGGSFFSQEAALKFIRREFGADAQIVMTHLMQKDAA
jgi:hypothetical protein